MTTESVALLIAALSMVVAGLSLGWQIAQWLLSGGRARATLLHGLVENGVGAYVGPVGKNGAGYDLTKLTRQGIEGTAVVGVQVTNHGRSPVVVDDVSLRLRGGVMRYIPVGERLGPDLPHTLEPGSNSSWYLPAENMVRLADSSREVFNEKVVGVYMAAHLGTGKTVETPETLRL